MNARALVLNVKGVLTIASYASFMPSLVSYDLLDRYMVERCGLYPFLNMSAHYLGISRIAVERLRSSPAL
jgi:hypothetical protein